MAIAIGIDLGTTNSVVSVYRRGAVETLKIDGHVMMPSVVSYRPGGVEMVGKAAKARCLIAPEETVSSVKRDMGAADKTYTIHGKTMTPVDISAAILKKIVAAASAELGEQVTRAVITVPAYFNADQREATKRAGEQAGLEVLRLLPEPTAAAVAYAMDRGRDQTIMVYDLGGGTFDVSILTVDGNDFKVRATGGNAKLGGDDFDDVIGAWAYQKFLAMNPDIDPAAITEDEMRKARQRLKETSEHAKIDLSESEDALLVIPEYLAGRTLEIGITRGQYQELIKKYLDLTIACVHGVLRDADLTADQIDRVILVGGSTRNKAVNALVTREIKEAYISDFVDEMVARGAAIVAANFDAPTPIVEFQDVTAHTHGINALNDEDKLIFVPIIPRQTKYPCRRGFLGTTQRSMQNVVEMRVYRGESEVPSDNTYLGRLAMPITPSFDKVHVAAIFHLNEDGIIEFTAVELPEGPETDEILDYAETLHGDLNMQAVDRLLASGKARSESVTINI